MGIWHRCSKAPPPQPTPGAGWACLAGGVGGVSGPHQVADSGAVHTSQSSGPNNVQAPSDSVCARAVSTCAAMQ